MAEDEAGPPARREPMLNLPPMVTTLIVVNVAVHALRALLPEQTDDVLVNELAFVPARFTIPGAFDWPALVSPITYQFLHAGLAHLFINMTFVMAVGTAVERHLGAWRTLAFSLICGVAAAATHLAVYPQDVAALVGFSGAASGQFAGALWVITRRARGRRSSRLLIVSALWVASNVIFGFTGLPVGDSTPIAWVAHIGGYFSGLVLIGWFDPRRRRA
jgi:membrane associated rhomboid family serine protease